MQRHEATIRQASEGEFQVGSLSYPNRYPSLRGRYIFFSAVVAFGASVEQIPVLPEIHVLPPLSLIALATLPVIFFRVKAQGFLRSLVAWFAFVAVHSVVLLYVDVTFGSEGYPRCAAWLRQFLSLASGMALFLALTMLFGKATDREILLGFLLGTLFPIGLGVCNAAWGLTGAAWLADALQFVRGDLFGLVPPHAMEAHPWRATALSNEPGGLALYLCILALPTTAVFALFTSRRFVGKMFALLLLIALVWTFSTVGFVVLAATLLGACAMGPGRIRLALGTVSILCVTLGVVFLALPENYMRTNVLSLTQGEPLHVTRTYSSFGPLLMAFDTRVLIGFGLGGSSAHFAEVMPAEALSSIQAVSWETMPNLKTLFGRLLAESGVIGVVLLAFVLLQAHRYSYRADAVGAVPRPLLCAARWGLVGTVAGSFLGLASFSLPILWIWLAVIAARTCKVKSGYPLEGIVG